MFRMGGLQWGRGLSTPEISSSRPSRSSKCRLQWGRGLSTPEMGSETKRETRRKERFNGAGVFRPRKWLAGAPQSRLRDALQWGRGLSTPEMERLVEICNREIRLQWGRGLSTPEIRNRASRGGRASRLQWGRGLSTPEMCRLRRVHVEEIAGASMGPGSFDPGNLPRPARNRADRIASMGPGSFDPGNASYNRAMDKNEQGFNGAGVFRPRKYTAGCSPAAGSTCFNGAGVFRPRKWERHNRRHRRNALLQWGRGLSTPEIRRTDTDTTGQPAASMGPGSFDPGNPRRTSLSTLMWPRFNGAGVFRPRK